MASKLMFVVFFVMLVSLAVSVHKDYDKKMKMKDAEQGGQSREGCTILSRLSMFIIGSKYSYKMPLLLQDNVAVFIHLTIIYFLYIIRVGCPSGSCFQESNCNGLHNFAQTEFECCNQLHGKSWCSFSQTCIQC